MESKEIELGDNNPSANYAGGRGNRSRAGQRGRGRGGGRGSGRGGAPPPASTNPKLLTGGGCYTCGGPHFQENCPKWLATAEGKAHCIAIVNKKAADNKAVDNNAGKKKSTKMARKVANNNSGNKFKKSLYNYTNPTCKHQALKTTDLLRQKIYLDSAASIHVNPY